MYSLKNGALRLTFYIVAALAVVVSVNVAPDAAEMLIARGQGNREVRIENVFYSCVGGNSFAMVRNGRPEESTGDYDVVEAGGLSVYVPRWMSFEGDKPEIVTFPRKAGFRDVGVRNTKD